MKIITENRKARHDYTIEESFEAGIELKGTEVKSMRAGRANLKDSFAVIENGELYFVWECTSAPMSRETFLMWNLCVPVNY